MIVNCLSAVVALSPVSEIERQRCSETPDILLIGFCTNERSAIYSKCIGKLDEDVRCSVDEEMIEEFGFGVSL